MSSFPKEPVSVVDVIVSDQFELSAYVRPCRCEGIATKSGWSATSQPAPHQVVT